MRFLLDTHVVLWSLLEPGEISPEVKGALENPHNELWISPMTVWEILVLDGKGRIELDAPSPEEWIREMLESVPFMEAPLNCEIALTSRDVDLAHQDPADRFIAATAVVHDLVLITADKRLLASAQLQTMSC